MTGFEGPRGPINNNAGEEFSARNPEYLRAYRLAEVCRGLANIFEAIDEAYDIAAHEVMISPDGEKVVSEFNAELQCAVERLQETNETAIHNSYHYNRRNYQVLTETMQRLGVVLINLKDDVTQIVADITSANGLAPYEPMRSSIESHCKKLRSCARELEAAAETENLPQARQRVASSWSSLVLPAAAAVGGYFLYQEFFGRRRD